MAPLTNFLLAASLLTPFALGAPWLNARAISTYTETDIIWVTVEETTTVWVEAAAATPTPAVATTTTTVEADAGVMPAVFAETTYTPSTMQMITVAPSPDVESPAAWSSPTPAPATAAAPSAAPVVAAPVPAAPVPAAPVPAAPVPAAPVAESSPSPSAANVQANSVSGSDSATCEGQGNACEGDVTHWDGGLGACGWTVNTNSDMEIALPYEFMGTQSNGNPYCGRSLTLFNPTSGTTVQATVGDKCMGCVGRSIDCTDALFNAITDGTGDGRVHGIEWWFN